MDTGKNIYNAFKVVLETHHNVDKLMKYCMAYALESNAYNLLSPKFLRWKTDQNSDAWSLNSFILLFQKNAEVGDYQANETEAKNTNADILVMEINLCELHRGQKYQSLAGSTIDQPVINLSRYIYKDESLFPETVSPTDHWRFYWSLRNENLHFRKTEHENIYYGEFDKLNFDDLCDKYYWGLRKVLTKEISMVEVTNKNVDEKIFQTFDFLSTIDVQSRSIGT